MYLAGPLSKVEYEYSVRSDVILLAAIVFHISEAWLKCDGRQRSLHQPTLLNDCVDAVKLC